MILSTDMWPTKLSFARAGHRAALLPDDTGLMLGGIDADERAIDTITRPRQNGRLTFNGSAAQPVTARVTANTLGNVTLRLLKSDGASLTSSSSSSSSFNLTMQTLLTNDTYVVTVDPNGPGTGGMSVSVTSP